MSVWMRPVGGAVAIGVAVSVWWRHRGTVVGRPVARAVVLAVMFVALGVVVRTVPVVARFDIAVVDWFVAHRSPRASVAVSIVTACADPTGLAALTLVVVAVLSWRGRSLVPLVLVPSAVAVASLAIPWAKGVFGVGRPPVETRLAVVGDAAYPSGHVTGTTAAVIAVVLLSGSSVSRVVAGVMVVAVAVSRVYLGVHWPSDVVGGVLFGAAIAMAIDALAALMHHRQHSCGGRPAVLGHEGDAPFRVDPPHRGGLRRLGVG